MILIYIYGLKIKSVGLSDNNKLFLNTVAYNFESITSNASQKITLKVLKSVYFVVCTCYI